jgi:hypothetical protein
MAIPLNIGTDDAPDVIDLEKVSLTTVCDDPDTEKCCVSLQRVNGQERVIRGGQVKRVIADIRKASEQNPSFQRNVLIEPSQSS